MSDSTVRSPVDLQGMDLEELTLFLAELGEPAYRARQIMRWLYRNGAVDPMSMTDLPARLRERLAQDAFIGAPRVREIQDSVDGTRKFLFELRDGATVESVLIRDGSRLTACLSSQVGCGIGCSFCATSLAGLERNLSASEILGQLLAMQRVTNERITNVVMMGMGEPLANYKSVMKAICLMIHPLGVGIGQRHITISTSGVVPGIRRLADEGLQVGLAVSLHAPDDAVRDRLVPLNRKYPLAALMEACYDYVAKTGRRITMEYVMIDGVNDTPEMAKRLGELLRSLLCHVNLIPLNPVPETGLARSSERSIVRFARILMDCGVKVTVRKEMGTDIDAACGQLRRRRGL